MNPVEQLMQSFSASPAIVGLLGLSPNASAQSGDQSAQFADALSALQNVSPTAIAGLTETQGQGAGTSFDTEALEAASDLLASLGVTISSEQLSAAGFANAIGKAEGAGPQSALIAQAGLVQFDGSTNGLLGFLQQDVTINPANGTDAPTLQVLPISALEKLGLDLENLPALPSSSQLAAVDQTGQSGASHILPQDAISKLLATDTPATLAATSASAAQSADAAIANATTLTAQTADAAGTATDATNLDASGEDAQSSLAKAIPPLSSGAGQQQVQQEQSSGHSAAKAASALAGQATAAQQATAQKPAEDIAQPEGHVTATAQAQQQVAANQNGANQNGSLGNKKSSSAAGSPQGVGKSGPDQSQAQRLGASSDESLKDALKDALTQKPVEPVSARPESTPAAPRESAVPLTPERLAGFSDTSAASSLASGLGAMKGESHFFSSMGLLGGKATQEMAHQVGQQLNAHVTKAVKDGQNEFTLRLNPTELGKVQVKLNFLDNGRVQAQVMAERPETLDLLQRDTRGLERAIEAGGNKADGGIQFSLDTGDQQSAGRSFAEAMQQEKMRDELAARSGEFTGDGEAPMDDMVEEEIPLEDILANVSTDTGLDIRI